MTFEHEDLLAAISVDLPTFIGAAFGEINRAGRYQPNWHIDAVAHLLQQVAEGRQKRVLISMPPRYLKSHCCSISFPAWLLGRDPQRRIVCVSYSNDLAVEHARACRALIESQLYREAFPETRLHARHNTESDFATTRHGRRLATSVGGTLTGQGGDLIIIDDPLKAQDAYSDVARRRVNEWFVSTLFSRLDSKKDDAIVVVMQRLHVDDLIGYLLEKGGFFHLDLQAIAETQQAVEIGPGRSSIRQPGEALHAEREPLSVLADIKRQIGEMEFNTQYQQRPVPPEGNMIRWSWLKPYDQLPAPEPNDVVVQSWDTAGKTGDNNDWSVCTTWYVKGHDYYLIDVCRAKLELPDLKKQLVALADRHRARKILVEDTLGGVALVQEVRQISAHRPELVKPIGEKKLRLYSQTVVMENGQVRIPRTISWLDAFKIELLAFPNGKHDDQVDSMSQFLTWVEQRKRRTVYTRHFSV